MTTDCEFRTGWTQAGGRQLFTAIEGRRHWVVTAVFDPTSDVPARRILRDGTTEPVEDAPGVTFYGPDQLDPATRDTNWPSFDEFRAIAPEYGYLVDHAEASLAEGSDIWSTPGIHTRRQSR